eukprot:2452916-Prorocentrum_lima.AAC.1
MFAKRGKSKTSLTKAWWVNIFLYLRGTTLKPGQKNESKDSRKVLQHDAKGVSAMNMEAHSIP